MLLMGAASITWASGRGLGPGNLEFFGPQMTLAYRLDAISQNFFNFFNFFGPQMALAYRLDAISQSPKNLNYYGPAPSHLPS